MLELLYTSPRHTKKLSSIKTLKSDNDIYRTKRILDLKHHRDIDIAKLEKKLEEREKEMEVSQI